MNICIFCQQIAFCNRVARADDSVVIKATDASALPTNQQICGGPSSEETSLSEVAWRLEALRSSSSPPEGTRNALSFNKR